MRTPPRAGGRRGAGSWQHPRGGELDLEVTRDHGGVAIVTRPEQLAEVPFEQRGRSLGLAPGGDAMRVGGEPGADVGLRVELAERTGRDALALRREHVKMALAVGDPRGLDER